MRFKGEFSTAFSLFALAGLLGAAFLWPRSLPASPDFRFDRLSLEHGLSQSSVFGLAEDRYGFLWIATEQGLDRFDGFGVETLRYAPGEARSLTHSGIRALLVDHEGMLWVGTWDGLNRVDPRDLSVRRYAAPAPHDQAAFSVQADGLGQVCGERLLVQTRDALWWLDLTGEDRDLKPLMIGETDHVGLPNSWLMADAQSAWLANATTLWRLDCQGMRLQQLKHLPPSGDPIAERGRHRLARLPEGGLLWAASDGLRLLDPANDRLRTRPIEQPPPWSEQAPLAVHVDDQGQPWVLLPKAILAIDPADLTRWTLAAELPELQSNSISHRLDSARSGDGVLWLAGSFGLGVVDEPGRQLRMLEHDPSRPDSLPPTLGRVGYRLLADRFGVLWVGANLGGLARYVPEQHRFGRVPLALQGLSRVVRGVVEVSDGERSWLWVGYDEAGIEVLELDRAGTFSASLSFRANGQQPGGLPGNQVVAMAREPGNQRVWVLGNDWLAWHDPSPRKAGFVPVPIPDDFSSPRALGFSRDGQTLLVTTSTELWRLKLDQPTPTLRPLLSEFPSRQNTDFYPVLELANGAIALGGRHGLSLINPDAGTHHFHDLGVGQVGSPARFVFSLAEAGNGDLWLGTHGGGLVQISSAGLVQRDPPLRRWTSAEGLADNTVYAILVDGDGCLWVSGNRGLSQLCPDNERLRNFGLHDGLQAYEFNGRVADIGPGGRFYLGGIKGINHFWPGDIVDHPQPPIVRLAAVSVAGQDKDKSSWQQPLRLRHDQNELTIDFIGLHSTAPARIRFSYRLRGLDNEWIDAGQLRRVRYPALPTGEYRFELRAANPDGVWSEPREMLEAVIKPPPWRTWPAYLGYLLVLLAGSAFLAWTVRQRRLQLEALVRQRTGELADRNQTVSRQAAELEELLQSRQALYANVSHELRTPLTLIRAGLERLKRNPEDSEALALGERYTQRLDRLVDQLLDLSRVRADAFRPEIQAWSLDDWLRGIAHDHAALAEQRQLQLDLNIQGQWHTHCNRELLEKCLGNLLSNALKYTPPGGQVVVRLGGSTDQADIEVCDTGPGVPPDQQASIFQRFQRLPAHENQAEKGAGIGLALVHEAIQALDGEIHLYSRPGEGSRFILVIPAQQVEQDSKAPDSAPDQAPGLPEAPVPLVAPSETLPEQAGNGKAARLGTLLIVEDNRDLRRHLKGLLSDQWKIITAADGDQALARLAAHDIDIVLSDIMMPNMDGLELLRRIRNNLATSHIPFLILTARRDADTRLQGLRLAADAVLTKPFNHDELRLKLTNAVRAIESLRRQTMADNGNEPTISALDQAFMDQVNSWLEAHFSDSATRISDLAQRLDLDERSLQRKTRALFGKPPRSILTDYRLDRAKHMLAASERTITEIAAECGFSSASYFSQQFSKHFGKPPGSWKTEKKARKS